MKGQSTKIKRALTINGEEISIEEAQNGRNGYLCLGCDSEVIAAKGDIMDWHFKHYANDKRKAEIKCTIYNESYRHKIAKEILLEINTIKVPNLYRFKGDKKYKIFDSKLISANYVRPEISFFENENGEVKSSQKANVKDLLIKPDITFFNESNEPILLVELVKSNDIGKEKLYKIKALDLPVLKVKIPKDSIENIRKSFYSSTLKNWVHHPYLYNEINELPKINPEGLSQTDEEQRRFYEESIECRKFQIRDLIRQIRKYLESQSYIRRRTEIRQRTEKLEDATIGEQRRAAEIQESIDSEFREEERSISEAEERYTKLELEYIKKREKLNREIELSIGDEKGDIDEFRRERETIEEDIEKEIRNTQGNFIRKQQQISRIKRDIEKSRGDFESRREGNQRTIRDREQRKIESDINSERELEAELERARRRRNSIKEFIQSTFGESTQGEMETLNQFPDLVGDIKQKFTKQIGSMDDYFKIKRMSEDAKRCRLGNDEDRLASIKEEWIENYSGKKFKNY